MDSPAPDPPRHALSTRIWHVATAVAVIMLLMSGLGISNAHPRLYWGEFGANADHAWALLPRFPGWMTIPTRYNLADSREWHFAFAWVFGWGLALYMAAILVRGALRQKYRIDRADVSPRRLWRDVRDHVRLHFHEGEAARPYAPLQKLVYTGMIFIVFPLMIATGLALSPGMDAAWPWLTEIWGGRQSARSVHAVLAGAVALFIFVHLLMVLMSGPIDQLRGIITGRKRGDAR